MDHTHRKPPQQPIRQRRNHRQHFEITVELRKIESHQSPKRSLQRRVRPSDATESYRLTQRDQRHIESVRRHHHHRPETTQQPGRRRADRWQPQRLHVLIPRREHDWSRRGWAIPSPHGERIGKRQVHAHPAHDVSFIEHSPPSNTRTLPVTSASSLSVGNPSSQSGSRQAIDSNVGFESNETAS